MIKILLCYVLIVLLELTILPTANWIQKIDRELSRKWCHILNGVILWTGSYYMFGTSIHIALAALIYLIASVGLQNLGLIADEREDETLNNPKATALQGLGYLTLSIQAIINPEWMLPYGLAVFTLCFGDAFAALLGIKYGKYTMKLPHNKSLAGFIAFIVFAVLGMIIPCIMMGYGLTLIPQLLVLATIGAVIEIYAGDWDNYMIQIIVGLIAFLII